MRDRENKRSNLGIIKSPAVLVTPACSRKSFGAASAEAAPSNQSPITNHLSLFSSAFGALPASPAQIFVLGSFSYFFARRDIGELHDPGGSLSGFILTDGRLERQFSVSDLG